MAALCDDAQLSGAMLPAKMAILTQGSYIPKSEWQFFSKTQPNQRSPIKKAHTLSGTTSKDASKEAPD